MYATVTIVHSLTSYTFIELVMITKFYLLLLESVVCATMVQVVTYTTHYQCETFVTA